MHSKYIPGQWNAICDRCGFQFKNIALREEWTGLRVCKGCFEVRHPQTLIKVPNENPGAPWSRPVGTASYVTPTYASILTEDSHDIVTELGVILQPET